MKDEVFRQRVYQVHESWAERRQAGALATMGTFDAQLELLRLMYDWAREGVEEIRAVYGEELPLTLSEPPNGESVAPTFTVTLGGAHWASFTLESTKRRGGGEAWHVAAAMGTAGGGGADAEAGRGGRIRRWTRRRLDDLLLTLLGAYERSRTRG